MFWPGFFVSFETLSSLEGHEKMGSISPSVLPQLLLAMRKRKFFSWLFEVCFSWIKAHSKMQLKGTGATKWKMNPSVSKGRTGHLQLPPANSWPEGKNNPLNSSPVPPQKMTQPQWDLCFNTYAPCPVTSQFFPQFSYALFILHLFDHDFPRPMGRE